MKEFLQDMVKRTKKDIENMKKAQILIVGKTGAGKSTLINAVFNGELAKTGVGRPVTEKFELFEKEGIPLRIYDSRGYELNSDSSAVLNEFYNLTDMKKNEGEAIDLVWFAINASSNRIEDTEIELIKKMALRLPLIIVLTLSVGDDAIRLKKYIENLRLGQRYIVNVLSKDFDLIGDMGVRAYGLGELVDLSLKSIADEKSGESFVSAQRVDIEKKAEYALSWAKKYIKMSFGVGFTPIPFQDSKILVPLEITMLVHMTSIFGISMKKSLISNIVVSSLGTSSASFIGRSIVSGILKMIPGAGSTIGGLISGATASAVTYALAVSYIELLKYVYIKESRKEKVDDEDMKKIFDRAFKLNLRNKRMDGDER